MIIWGGLEYATQDVPGAKGAGKEKILNAIFGLVLVLSPVLVFSIINPRILNLSLNLPRLILSTHRIRQRLHPPTINRSGQFVDQISRVLHQYLLLAVLRARFLLK